MNTVKVTFANGDHLTTGINGTREEILAYYIGRTFNLGTGQEGQPEDVMAKAVAVEFLDGPPAVTIEPATGWPYAQMKAAHLSGAPVWIEVTEDFYDQMLNILPPKDQTNGRFLVGEAYSHNAAGFAIYAGLVQWHGRYFGRYSTRADFPAMHAALIAHLSAVPV